MAATETLAELGISLPPVAAPVAAYTPALRVGNQVWTSGQLPFVDGQLPATGKVGADISAAKAEEFARIAALNALAAIDAVAGLDAVTRVLKVVVFVASAEDFVDQPLVANGASNLMTDVFGEAGTHARSAVGVAVLPKDSPVEVEVIVEVAGDGATEPASVR
ncbi:RidA family protein [Corynebacterium uterequi]|uniref:Putative translation initiation inhibitor, yjgF family n=1 Tax=Corynebacterium uterequi TaxID=1072256 RepID=A0A0G3HA10_9CORY|nr:RidA family protein [Corynebacterium uterequi]AKK10186.1 putative translation initiation inhibitor, yjgF family [Corynebacterium uterequi]